MTTHAGDPIPPVQTRIDAAAMRVWAAALHDPNPIHLDVAAVQAKGLGDKVINQGPANVAYLLNALAAAFPRGSLEYLDVRFVANVFAEDLVTATGVVTQVTAEGEARHIDCDILLEVAGRGIALRGTAKILLPQL
jgi:3-hydroxybutyryl-CoA dehydratase